MPLALALDYVSSLIFM